MGTTNTPGDLVSPLLGPVQTDAERSARAEARAWLGLCRCGIDRDACYRECDRADGSEPHDERLARTCPDCRHLHDEVPAVGEMTTCARCEADLEVRDHELVLALCCADCHALRPEDHLEAVGRMDPGGQHVAVLCDENHGDCAGQARKLEERTRRQAAYEAHCDDVGDEMRMGGVA